MTVRCEVEGCRGNAPCPACLAGLSVALEKGLKRTFPGATGALERPLIHSVMRELKIELDAYWAKVVSGPKGKGKKTKLTRKRNAYA